MAPRSIKKSDSPHREKLKWQNYSDRSWRKGLKGCGNGHMAVNLLGTIDDPLNACVSQTCPKELAETAADHDLLIKQKGR